MSGKVDRVLNNPRSMANSLPSSEWLVKVWGADFCCGIHGAMRWRRGAKKGASTQRRRQGRDVIERELDAYESVPAHDRIEPSEHRIDET